MHKGFVNAFNKVEIATLCQKITKKYEQNKNKIKNKTLSHSFVQVIEIKTNRRI
jgi:hypothetical protein